MSFDWSHYLRLAEILVDTPEDALLKEAAYRAAISRTYYAAFCSCRNYARDKDNLLPSDKSDVHGQIIDHFSKSADSDKNVIGKILRRLRDDRNSADYEDEYYGDFALDAKKMIRQAKQVLELLEKL